MDKKNLIIKLFKSLRGEKELLVFILISREVFESDPLHNQTLIYYCIFSLNHGYMLLNFKMHNLSIYPTFNFLIIELFFQFIKAE
jgi:hypothetical protein